MRKLLFFSFFLLVAIVLFSAPAFGYVIEGNSVVFENAKARLVVTPHTASNPNPGRPYEQEFELTNKTAQDADIYVAYVFDGKIRSGKIERKGLDEEWNDISHLFSLYKGPIWGSGFDRHVYHTSADYLVLAGQTRTWRLSYYPSFYDSGKKWDLVFYAGDSWDCILDGSCDIEWVLDPWWDNDFVNRKSIEISGSHSEIDTNYTFTLTLDTSLPEFALADLNDLRMIVVDDNGENVQLHRDIDAPKSSSTIIRWKNYKTIAANVDFNGTDTNGYWVYYNNPAADSPPDDWIDVYWFGDDFNRATLTGAPYTEWTTHGVGGGEFVGIVDNALDINGVVGASFGRALLEDANWLYETAVAFDVLDANGNPPESIQTGVASCNNAVLNACADSTKLTLGSFSGAFWTVGNSAGEGSVQPFAGSTPNVFFDANILSLVNDLNGWTGGSALRISSTKFDTAENVFFPSVMSGIGGFTFSIDWIKITQVLFQEPSVTAGAQETLNSVVADFNVSPLAPYVLDQENGISSFTLDFNDLSIYAFGDSYSSTSWLEDTVEFSTDQNASRSFSTVGDFNITQIVTSTDSNVSQAETTITIQQAPQGIDINFGYNTFANNVDVNFEVTADGTINFAVWGFPNDENQTGTNINKIFTTDGVKEVCVIVNGAGDVNKLHCEDFTSTRVLVKRPLDKVTSAVLTPFTVSTNDITRQLYSGQNADLNVFLFFDSGDDQNVLFTVDFNASYFSSTFLIETNDSDTFRTIQPLLVLVSQSVSSVFHVINAITQNTIPDVVIESRQGGVLIESTITDSTGSATLNFIVADTYNLTFIVQGIVSLEQEIRPIDTEYFIYLFLEEIITEPQDPETITVIFDPPIGQVQERDDGNFTLTQTVSATRASITQINIQVNQKGILFFDSNFTGNTGGTFSQDLNASLFDANSPIRVTVRVTSSLIDETTKSMSYFIQLKTQLSFLDAINDLGLNLGGIGRIVLVVLSSFVIVGGFSQATRNPQILGGIVMLWMGAFTAIGLNENYVVWVPVPVFLFAAIGAVTLYLNR